MKKELIGKTPSGTAIYRVDGAEVRNTLDTDFALGAHGLIKPYIPPDEIWIEGVSDECANLGHEIYEYERMKGAALPYDKAHEEANQFEHKLRQWGACSVEDLLKAPTNPRVAKIPEARVRELKHHEELVLQAIKDRPDITLPELEQLTKLEPVQIDGAVRRLEEAILTKQEGKMTPGGLTPSSYRLTPSGVKEPWQMTKVGYAEAQIQKSRTLIEAWNKAGSKGIPPTAAPSIYEIAPLAEKAGYVMPRDADKVLRIPYHQLRVEAALKQGLPVPTEVLKDYPDLAAKAVPKAEAEGKCH